MFKRWKSKNADSPVLLTPPPSKPINKGPSTEHIKLVQQKFDPAEALRLEDTVISPETPSIPFGDGEDKLFGIENYGYSCYIASILQALYHTPEFRMAILEAPFRSMEKRKRKYTMPGEKPHGFALAIQNANSVNNHIENGNNNNDNSISSDTQQPTLPTSPNSHSNNSSSLVSNVSLPLLGRKKNGSDSSGANSATSSTTMIPTIPMNHTSSSSHLETALLEDYPSFKNLKINYFLNNQRNLTIVGIVNDKAATLEFRKRAALIQGPIINVDTSFSNEYSMSESVFTTLKDTFESIVENASNTSVVSPWNLVERIKIDNEMFREAMHQDAHEFLNFLINSIMETTKDELNLNLINDIFEGELTSETRCLTCDNSSYRDEKFLDLSIDLEQNSSITNCIKLFSQMEMLCDKNKFYCESCFSYQEAAKTVKLKKLPKILAFHLKRFKYSEKLGRMVKLFHRIEYTKTLRIFNTTDDSNEADKLYELYVVVVHIGGGPYHGHYVCLVKTKMYGWLLFDDETVEKINENFVFKFFGDGAGIATAYLVFYREVVNEEQFKKDELYSGLSDDEEEEEVEIDVEQEKKEVRDESVNTSFNSFSNGRRDLREEDAALAKTSSLTINDDLDPFSTTNSHSNSIENSIKGNNNTTNNNNNANDGVTKKSSMFKQGDKARSIFGFRKK